jgi:hypothetical protein
MLSLISPIFFPSWRFFSEVDPSPRFLLAFLSNENDTPDTWQEFSPLPVKVTLLRSLANLFWNPTWNQRLYLNSCAERLLNEYTLEREREIVARLLLAISNSGETLTSDARYIIVRIDTLIREHKHITRTTSFVSKPHAFAQLLVVTGEQQ